MKPGDRVVHWYAGPGTVRQVSKTGRSVRVLWDRYKWVGGCFGKDLKPEQRTGPRQEEGR